MSATKLFAPVALLTLLSAVAQPAVADPQRGRDDRQRSESRERATPRESGRQSSSDRRSDVRRESPRASRSYEARGSDDSGRTSRQRDARANDARSYGSRESGWSNGRSNDRSDSRAGAARSYDRRGDTYSTYGNGGRRVDTSPRNYSSSGWGRAVPRSYRSYGPSYRPSYRPSYGSSYRSWYRSDYYYSRPYYSFRPRLSVGLGLWLGYSVSLPSYGYAPYPVYGYPSGGYVNVTPTRTRYGAVSFEISPAHADLYVDGTLIGQVGDFDPNNPPLTLTPGVHRIDVVADGYEPLTFDADVMPGQVIPYRGEMQPY